MMQVDPLGPGISEIGISWHRKIGKVCRDFFLEFSEQESHIA
jgi:hypothetical protein